MKTLTLVLSIGLVATPAAAQSSGKPPAPESPAGKQKTIAQGTPAAASAFTTVERDRAIKLADEASAAGRRDEAARLLASAADRFASVQVLLRLAMLQAKDGEPARALSALHRARALAPNSEDVLSAFARVSLAARAPVPAIVPLIALTRLCPAVTEYHYLLGVALLQAGDLEPAATALMEANRLEPDRALTLLALGLALNARKLHGEAKEHLARATQLEPGNLDATAALAETEEALGDSAAAEAHARHVLSVNGRHAAAHLVLGLILMKQERYTEARESLEAAVAADPGSSKAHYQLSLACARLGDDACAQKHLDLYRQALRELEQRLTTLRTETGMSNGVKRP